MSSPSAMISPRLTPIRNSSRCALPAAVLCEVNACWISRLLSTASVTLGNSASQPSPVLLMMRPPNRVVAGFTMSARTVCSELSVPASSFYIRRV
jgi:hypothetical protein